MIEPGIEPKTADAATWPGSAEMSLALSAALASGTAVGQQGWKVESWRRCAGGPEALGDAGSQNPRGRQAPAQHARGQLKNNLSEEVCPSLPQELEAALAQKSKLIGPGDLPADLTPAQRHTALGYQAKGLEFVKAQARSLRV